MTNQNVRRGDLRCRQQSVQLFNQVRGDAWLGRRIAPAKPGTVIRTSSCKARDPGLYGRPIERGSSYSGFKDYGRTTLPRIHQMQTQVRTRASDVHQQTRRRKLALVASGSGRLIEESRQRKKHNQQSDEKDDSQSRDSTAFNSRSGGAFNSDAQF
jgi:hypothetical protein